MLDPQRLHGDNSLRELKVREIKKTHLYTNIYKINQVHGFGSSLRFKYYSSHTEM